MKKQDAIKNTVKALRYSFLQGNSQVPNIQELIDQWVFETLVVLSVKIEPEQLKQKIASIEWY